MRRTVWLIQKENQASRGLFGCICYDNLTPGQKGVEDPSANTNETSVMSSEQHGRGKKVRAGTEDLIHLTQKAAEVHEDGGNTMCSGLS